MRDVSEQHLAEAALRNLLLSSSFDLRIHAQNVQAATSLLLENETVRRDPEAAFLASAVQSSCNLLLGIVSNVIEMRKLERGELTLSLQTFNVADAVRDVLQSCGMGLQQGARLRWVNEAEAALPPLIEADVSHVSQIMMNLVGNAIKFARGSEVRVAVCMEPLGAAASEGHEQQEVPADGLQVLRVDVSDQGVGLTPEECERVFRPFERAAPEKVRNCSCPRARCAVSHASRSRQGGGTGLGLHFSRSFARAMGGSVTVMSTPGVGSTCVCAVRLCFFSHAVDARLLARSQTTCLPGQVHASRSGARGHDGSRRAARCACRQCAGGAPVAAGTACGC